MSRTTAPGIRSASTTGAGLRRVADCDMGSASLMTGFDVRADSLGPYRMPTAGNYPGPGYPCVPARPAAYTVTYPDAEQSGPHQAPAISSSSRPVSPVIGVGGRNAADGLVTTRAREANRWSVAGRPPNAADRAAVGVASMT